MRATEFIRNMLDFIDAMDQPKVTVIDVEKSEDDNPYDDEKRRMALPSAKIFIFEAPNENGRLSRRRLGRP